MALGDKKYASLIEDWGQPGKPATLDSNGKLAEAQRPSPTDLNAADLSLSNLTDKPAALYHLGAAPKKNLLDNWYFVGGGTEGSFPINQNGNSVYNGGAISIDRWFATMTCKVTLEEDGVLLENTSQSNECYFRQVVATPYDSGEFVTSVLASDVIGESAFYFYYKDGTFAERQNISDGLTYKTINTGRHIARVQFTIGAGASLKLKAIKLERGNTQTLARQNNGIWMLHEVPNYSEELAKCQRYQIKLSGGLLPAYTISTSVIYFFIPMPVSMKTGNDTAIISPNNLSVRSNGVVQDGFTFEVYSIQNNGVMVKASKTSHGLTSASLSAGGLSIISNNL